MDLSSSPEWPSRHIEKRNPSITPRRFGRFFTPRLTQPSEGRILATLDDTSVNRLPRPQLEPLSPDSLGSDPFSSDHILSSPSQGLDASNGERRKRKRPVQPELGTKRRGALFEEIIQAREARITRGDGPKQPDTVEPNAILDDTQEKGKATLVGPYPTRSWSYLCLHSQDEIFKSSRSGVRSSAKTFFSADSAVFAADPKAPLVSAHPLCIVLS